MVNVTHKEEIGQPPPFMCVCDGYWFLIRNGKGGILRGCPYLLKPTRKCVPIGVCPAFILTKNVYKNLRVHAL